MGNTKKDLDTTLEGFKRNDENILKKVYLRVYPKVKLHVLRNNGSEAEAKDIYQEAFVACWLSVKENRFNEGNLEGYLFTIAKNKWTDHIRSVRFKKTVRQRDIPTVVEEDVKKPDEAAEREQAIMITALNQLGDTCKNLLTLFYFERKPMEEIGELLDLTPASARNKKYRCMEQLRALAKKAKNDG